MHVRAFPSLAPITSLILWVMKIFLNFLVLTIIFLESTLSIVDLGDIIDALRRHKFQSTKWKQLGLGLGLNINTLEVVEADNNRTDEYLCAMFSAWLRLDYDYEGKGMPSWDKLAYALKNIQSDYTALKIKEEFCQ